MPKATTIRELLQAEGIRTTGDLARWCVKRGRAGQSRYDVLVAEFGEVNADRIMRLVEVAHWDFDPKPASRNPR